jgi:hypothetical protein
MTSTTYINKTCANTLLNQNKTPQYKIIGEQIFAGFGKWIQLFETFEFPLPVEIKNKFYKAIAWDFDETSIKYSYVNFTGHKQTFYGTLEQLLHEPYPYIHLIKHELLTKMLNKQGFYQFIDDTNGASFRIQLNH